jgi:serine/threonine protein kinase
MNSLSEEDIQQLVSNRYKLTNLLGQGGFGKTFKAIDTQTGRVCAIKRFSYSSSNPQTQQTALDFFYAEAKHLQSLGNHPQIPQLLDYFDLEGQPYLVQEYIDGQNLEQELLLEGPMSQEAICELLRSLLPVLDFLHNQPKPVIHRDIKPANIIRRHSTGELVLVDFGAAKLATQTMLAQTGTMIGSPEFVAPEQTRGKPAFASDIYSLGVTAIHLLTGVSPFDLLDGENEWVWRSFLDGKVVNEAVGLLLDKMIDQKLSKRYRAALTVNADLSNINSVQPADIYAVEPSENAQIVKRHSQHKLIKFLLVGGTATSAIVVVPKLFSLVSFAIELRSILSFMATLNHVCGIISLLIVTVVESERTMSGENDVLESVTRIVLKGGGVLAAWLLINFLFKVLLAGI